MLVFNDMTQFYTIPFHLKSLNLMKSITESL